MKNLTLVIPLAQRESTLRALGQERCRRETQDGRWAASRDLHPRLNARPQAAGRAIFAVLRQPVVEDPPGAKPNYPANPAGCRLAPAKGSGRIPVERVDQAFQFHDAEVCSIFVHPSRPRACANPARKLASEPAALYQRAPQ